MSPADTDDAVVAEEAAVPEHSGVLVLGMHRSGTSAMTRVVNLAGLQIGAPESLIGADQDNRRGHWENEALSGFDEDLLGHFGGRWSGPPVIPEDAQLEAAAGPWGECAREMFARSLPATGWVWKDPRTCLLMPFWRRVLPGPPVVVAVLRNPLEIAASLERRNEMRVAYSMALWEHYQRSAMEGSRGLPTFVVLYDRLLDEPLQVWGELVTFLQHHGLEADPLSGEQEAVEFLDSGERHHVRSGGELDAHPDTSPEQAQLWATLLERTGDQSGVWAEDLPPATPRIQLALDEHHWMALRADVAVQLRAKLVEVEAATELELAGMREVNDALQAQEDALREALASSREEAVSARAVVRRLEGEYDDCAEGRSALVEALERAMNERDGYRWELLQRERHWWRRGRDRLSEIVRGPHR